MPKILPSQVVAQIEAAFGGITKDHHLRADASQPVASILRLYDQLPEAYFSLLDTTDYRRLLVAEAALRDALEVWRRTNEGDRARTGGAALRPLPGGDHAVLVLSDVLRKCPDTAPAESIQELTFLGNPDLAAILRQDMSTAYSTLANHEFKAACVMAGSVIEALLLWAVQRKVALVPAAIPACAAAGEAIPGNPNAPERWDLIHLLNIGHRIPVISDQTFNAANLTREFRNLIHPGLAQRTQVKATQGHAQLSVGAMQLVVDDLAARVAGGTL
jgi:hypothetical protein